MRLFIEDLVQITPHGIEIGLGLPTLDVRGRLIGASRRDQIILFAEIRP